ncbi:glycosyltransferase, partial [Alphaproteobacteria bacterium]|nr:glycosyltransferase [Alphaproteobacteria bacterium]
NNSLLIVGRGSVEYTIYLKDLINESQSNVILLGHKEGKEKIDLYTKSKVLVLPSHSENFGNVVLEALANSTPVIASKYTPWEEIEENQCGYWVDNSPESIQIYLEKIFTLSSDEYLNYCRNSHNLVCNNYNISQKINHLIDIYEKYSKKI